ncbi:cytochrome c [Agaribacter marinus]|uniref:Cytochrome c n=2 Tax=Agaribacter marinus TaxID=1431249 RepID=A0AA37SWZ1_9ALTE|nr:cytochrome c [Agaribacter marinus]
MKIKVSIAALIACLGMTTVIAQEMTEEEIAERIKPIGKVKVAGAVDESAAAAGPKSGKDIYNGACIACHGSGVLGAPKLHAAADWQPRLDEKGFDLVWKNAVDGINAMPPMGTCGDCTEDDIKSAIEYMIEGI